jgi:protein-L-isoaspartate(D-aspartate) O-methyltransferase
MFTTKGLQEDPKFVGLRRRLAEEVKKKGIKSAKVIDAIGAVPRQLFFPIDFEQFAYRDAAFPIGHGQTISQPFTVAYQTELLDLNDGDKVLEIGTGSGYQAAVLSAAGAKVYSVEVVKQLLVMATKVLKNLDRDIKLYLGDGSLGLPSEAPYQGIIVTAGAPEIPKSLIEQLAIGGRLIVPVGNDKENQKMMRITKLSATQTKTEVFGDFKFVPLVGKEGWGII